MKGTRLVLLILLLLLSCSLASCKPKAEEPPITEIPVQEVPEKLDPQIVMSTQYYDSIGNYIEIPMLVMPDGSEPNEAIRAINLALAEIQEQYQVIPDVVASNQQCIFYPTETDRYISLLLFRTRFFTDLNTGHTVSFVYDKKENRQVTIEDALALVDLTEQDLFHALSAQYDPSYAQSYPAVNICIQNHALEAFRLDRDGQPIFYLTARTDDADDTVQDAVSGADHLYIWADGVFTIYEQYNIGEEYSEGRIYPLISAEETVTMDPPLWNQWYFNGSKPNEETTISLPADIQDVLKDNQKFYYVAEGSSDYALMSISDVPALYDPNDNYMAVQAYTIVDLDGDGEAEAVLWICGTAGDMGGYLILHRSGHDVYGYRTNYRAFDGLKTDGTFHYSDYIGSKEGVAALSFTKNGLVWSDILSATGQAYVMDTFQINGETVSEMEYSDANEIQARKSDAEWYDFTDANIAENGTSTGIPGYSNISTPEFFNDIGKTLSELKNENPEGEFIVSLGGFPDCAAICFGEPEAEYVYYFFGTQSGDAEKALNEYEDQLKCAGFITTASILFPDMEDDMSFEDFFSLIDVDDYEYFGEDTITAEGWLRFAFNGMEVMVNTNEAAGGGWDVTGVERVKSNAPVSIVDPEILTSNQDLAKAIMFD